jgi:hypothetical protein
VVRPSSTDHRETDGREESSVTTDPETPNPSSYTSSSLLPEETKPAARAHASPAEIWARRMFLVTFVLLCTLLGVFLIVLPWRPEWADNPLFSGYPWVRSLFANPFFRGICSGFGVLDLWIAISETAHYHEDV